MLSALLWTVLLGAEAPAAEAPPTESPAQATRESEASIAKQVAGLVRALDDRELVRRDQAERELLALGAAALPHLPTINDRTPAEVALRVARVQQRLMLAEANAAAEPRHVTLHAKDLPLAEALAEIEKQTGNRIVDYREDFGEQPSEVKVNVDFEKTPFWQAIDQVLDQSKLTLYPYVGKRGSYVVTRPSDVDARSGRAVYAGIFRLEPARFEAMRDLRDPTARSLKFFFDATWEPRLQPIAILQPLGQVTAEGENGEALAVASAEAEPEASVQEGTAQMELEIPLQLPDRTTGKIRSLKGKLLALVPGPAADFRFPSPPVAERNVPPRRLEQRKAGATVTIDQVRRNNAAWEVSLRVKFDSPSIALESHRNWILDNVVYFQDAAGRKYEPGGFEQSRQTKDEVGINYFFDLPESPAKLEFVYRTPITILEMTVDYEFRDLPLP